MEGHFSLAKVSHIADKPSAWENLILCFSSQGIFILEKINYPHPSFCLSSSCHFVLSSLGFFIPLFFLTLINLYRIYIWRWVYICEGLAYLTLNWLIFFSRKFVHIMVVSHTMNCRFNERITSGFDYTLSTTNERTKICHTSNLKRSRFLKFLFAIHPICDNTYKQNV